MPGYQKPSNVTGSMNSGADFGGGQMAKGKQVYGGNTPASDKAGKMVDKEVVKGGIRKNNYAMPQQERKDAGRSAKTIPDVAQKNGFDPLSRGK